MKRLEYLRTKYNVVPDEDFKEILLKDPELAPNWPLIKDGSVIQYVYLDKLTQTWIFPEQTFSALVEADPTKNKMNVQWLFDICINMFSLKDNLHTFRRFIEEDLPKTMDNLILFEGNKRKNKFKEMASKNYAIKHLTDPTNINQYDTVDQLYAAVYPFKPVLNLSELEGQMENFVKLGEGEIPVRDEHYTIFIPKSLKASELFQFTSWCTARPNNSMFASYRKRLRPDGSESDYYILIDNKFFQGESDHIVQAHFESGQIMDKADRGYKELSSVDFPKSISVRNFFFETLKELTRQSYLKWIESGNKTSGFTGSNSNYIKYILEFGFGEILFDVLDTDTMAISYEKITIQKLPDMSKFKKLRTVYLNNVGLEGVNDDVFSSPDLEMFSIPMNKVESIPDGISKCKNLRFLNLLGNPITTLPESIKYLDPTMGGGLFKMNLPKCFQDYELVERLLPSVDVNYR